MRNGRFKLFVELGDDAKGRRIRKTKTIVATGPRQAAKMLATYEVEVYNSVHINPEPRHQLMIKLALVGD
ncbi:hypothetical protein M3197_03355 [Sporosarcina aquimarina]|uniref:hypothetical protein n=1 Tax=Sporosarcina aquimarina TaxID=114975 RepID=UPI00203D2550|nr:hypothetical protein [Sporosarcina aquimarina]MCM3756514.1 hypothetical protein [Sporosarcina aquimarina]